jgi:hypothetical protein
VHLQLIALLDDLDDLTYTLVDTRKSARAHQSFLFQMVINEVLEDVGCGLNVV